jgi:5-methylthioadenosine/S-adenosylhomocysteine deaminase
METKSLIIANACVLTCDAENHGGRRSILIRDGKIAAVSEDAPSLISRNHDATVMQADDLLVVPGFINTHVHSESLLLRVVTDGKAYATWDDDGPLRQASDRLLDPARRRDLSVLYQTFYSAHLKSGTTFAGEFPPPLDRDAFQIVVESIGRSMGRSVFHLRSWEQIEMVREASPPRLRFLISIGREEDVTVYSLESYVRVARELHAPIVAHIEELPGEADLVKRNFHKSMTAVLEDFGGLQPHTLLLHMNHASEADIAAVEKSGATICLCVRSSALKQTGYPMLRMLPSHRLSLAVGTDWGNVDMLAELKTLRQLPQFVADAPVFNTLDLVRMATINGATALQIDAETGSIEPGKKADLVLFDLATLRVPFFRKRPSASELADLLLDELDTRDIVAVLVGGEFAVSGGMLTTHPENELVAAYRSALSAWYPEEVGSTAPGQMTSQTGAALLEGESILDRTQEIIQPKPVRVMSPSAAAPPPDSRLATKPQLSKDVRKVFGEDDEF